MINDKLFGIAMILYLLATFGYVVYLVHRSKVTGWIGTGLAFAGWLVNTAAMVVRWIESHQAGYGYIPLSNMYESMVFFAWSIMLIYLVFERLYGYRAIGAFVAPLGFLGIAVVSLNPSISSEIQPLVPALQSNWLTAHVMTCFFGYGAFAVGFGVSIMYLLRHRTEARLGRDAPGILPPTKVLDDLAYKSVAVGFPLLTLGILTGAIWANYAWGTYWSWDPKETWSLITWFVYAAYLHARFTAGWRGVKLAWLSVVGFGCVIFTYWGVNFVLSGLHSYASG
ncbi:MAG: c-type cytochrome biogenesis protein CcsB [Candidatus Dadabacteria bacterium]|nr:MAG: c-type cytochrome biogenesis protein CcsB [Candidatus Dadabacteria bacterium]